MIQNRKKRLKKTVIDHTDHLCLMRFNVHWSLVFKKFNDWRSFSVLIRKTWFVIYIYTHMYNNNVDIWTLQPNVPNSAPYKAGKHIQPNKCKQNELEMSFLDLILQDWGFCIKVMPQGYHHNTNGIFKMHDISVRQTLGKFTNKVKIL